MKTYLIILLNLLIISATLTSCQQEGKMTIGMLIPANTVERYINESNYIKEKASQLGADVIIEFADNNDALQINQAKAMLDKVDGLCIIPVNGITAAEIVREYKASGKPVIAYNRLIQNCEPDYFITGDNNILAELMVNTALAQKPRGNYYLLGGDKFDINGIQLQTAIDSILKPHEESGAVNVVFRSLTQDWNPDLAAENLKKAINLSGIRPDAVIAAYDGMSVKCIEVIKELYGDVDDIVITGQDCELRAVKAIARGEQTMTAYHSPKNNGYACAEAIVALMNGKKADTKNITYTYNGMINVPTIKIPSILINKNNYEKELIQNGIFTRQEIED